MAAQVQFFDGKRHRVLLLGGDPVLVGGRAADIKVRGATVTRRHARLYRAGGRGWIEDLGGDGVWVNGTKVQSSALTNRDNVQVGELALDFFED